MRERKAAERLEARARRKALPQEMRKAAEAVIRHEVLTLPEVREAEAVASYVSVHSEVDTRELLRDLLRAGKRVAVPVVEPPERMGLAELSRLSELRPGAHRIPEPAPPHRIVGEPDVLLVPGLLFTRDGHRLGNGGGYFDRMLAAMPRATRVGLAFDAQLVEALPFEAHDEMLDVVVTEKGARRTGARRAEKQ